MMTLFCSPFSVSQQRQNKLTTADHVWQRVTALSVTLDYLCRMRSLISDTLSRGIQMYPELRYAFVKSAISRGHR